MNSTFWIGLILGAVFGIVLEFMSRPLQRFLDCRLETRAQVCGEQLRQEKSEIERQFRDFLVLQVLETTLIGALAGIGSGVMFGASTLVPVEDDAFQRLLVNAGHVIAVIGAVLVLRMAGDAITIARAARAKKTPPQKV